MSFWGGEESPAVAAENSHIFVTTSGISDPFDVVDSIHELSSQDGGFSGHDLEAIFQTVKNKLREKCISLDGDGVINCHFSERSAHSGGLMPTQVIEMWAYGTVVKLK